MFRAGFKPGIYDSLLLEFAVAYKPTQPPRLDRSCSLCLSLFPPVGLFMGILQTKGESEKERKRFSKFYIRPFLISALVYACSLVCRTRWLQIFEIYFSLSLSVEISSWYYSVFFCWLAAWRWFYIETLWQLNHFDVTTLYQQQHQATLTESFLSLLLSFCL